ncbi:MAG: helix-hairpin-helix domain-containing protein [Bacteroidia bacterium]
MKQFFRDYFTFNKRERNGVFILISIITVLVLYLNISSNFVSTKPVDFTKFENDVKQFKTSLASVSDSSQPFEKKYVSPASVDKTIVLKAERFNFNPNDLPEDDWKRLGLSVKQIRSIKNYETKGGKFRTKQDVKKMYAIPLQQYESLEPFIQIPIEEKTNATFVSAKLILTTKKPTIPLVELNTADSVQLTTLKGIGPFFAKTIVKYRNSIGGFVAKEQLMEVWKFDQEKFEEIEKFITVDASLIKKININTCEAADLKNGYLRWNVANAIINYRKSHGKYLTLEDIKKTDLVDDETYRKIVPYLILE